MCLNMAFDALMCKMCVAINLFASCVLYVHVNSGFDYCIKLVFHNYFVSLFFCFLEPVREALSINLCSISCLLLFPLFRGGE